MKKVVCSLSPVTFTRDSLPFMRVLVVEDDPDLLRALSRALREAGYAVDEANDGASGLSKALSTEYECVVLDLMLPKVDGWEILRQLRQKKKRPSWFFRRGTPCPTG